MSVDTTPRILIIGAGSRGHAYARAIATNTRGLIVGVAEPIPFKRAEFARTFNVPEDLTFSSWTEIVAARELVMQRIDGVCICTLDKTHAEIVLGLRSLGLHMLCEKPLGPTLEDSRRIHSSVAAGEPIIFAVGHVLRYSPHNQLLRQLVSEQLGDVVAINHTEPVGFWHFAHSYVRGNWRNGAPSLLTKCCHDIDLLLWLTAAQGHPTLVSSHGSLSQFRRRNKPPAAGVATNCLSCAAEPDCIYSAKKIYIERNLLARKSVKGWPNKIVAPEIEDAGSLVEAEAVLMERLAEDYGSEGAQGRAYYGRCVYEADNDVVDNQVVVLSWEGDRAPMTATLTMVAPTERICERFTKVYGTRGELTADSNTVTVFDFASGERRVYTPEQHLDSGHGGGDVGLAGAFMDAIAAVKGGMAVNEAQRKFINCTSGEALRAHEVVWWAEEARLSRQTLSWAEWKQEISLDS